MCPLHFIHQNYWGAVDSQGAAQGNHLPFSVQVAASVKGIQWVLLIIHACVMEGKEGRKLKYRKKILGQHAKKGLCRALISKHY